MEQKTKNFLVFVLAILILLGLWLFWITFKDLQTIRSQVVVSSPVSLERKEVRQPVYSDGQEELQAKIDGLVRKLSGLEKQNAQLLEGKRGLEQKVLVLEKEKELLENRLGSLKELKKAIRKVKRVMREKNIQDYLAKKKRQKEIDELESALGNKGFVLRGRVTTYKARVRIEVRPVK